MDRKKKITPITNEDYQAIIDNSVQGAGSRLVGNAAEQKKMFVKPIANTDGTPNVLEKVQRLADEIIEVVKEGDAAVDILANALSEVAQALNTKLSMTDKPNKLYGTDKYGRSTVYELNDVGDIIGVDLGFEIVKELPQEGAVNVLYFIPIDDAEDDNLFEEWAWLNKGTEEEPAYGWERIGSKKVTIDHSEYVKFTDYASKDKAGVAKLNENNSGMRIVNGELKLYPSSPTALTFRPQTGVNYNETAPITVGNLNIAVIAALTDDKKILLTDDDKAKACETIGAVKRNPNESVGFMRAYGMTSTGEETTYRIVNGTMASTVALRGVNGRLMVGNPEADADAVPKKYAEDNFVAKQANTGSMNVVYGEEHSGKGSKMFTLASGGTGDMTIPMRNANGQFDVREPQSDLNVANKKYVDDNKGTKLYLHTIACDGVIVGGGSDGTNVLFSVFIVNALESVNSIFNALSVPVLYISITFEGWNVMVLDIVHQLNATYLGFLDQDGVVYVRIDGELGVETTELSKFGE